MFFVAALVICLVIKFRFPKGKSIARIIEERYGRPALLLFRKLMVLQSSTFTEHLQLTAAVHIRRTIYLLAIKINYDQN